MFKASKIWTVHRITVYYIYIVFHRILPVILHFEKDKMSLICPSISEERKENKGTKEKEKLLHDESQQNG